MWSKRLILTFSLLLLLSFWVFCQDARQGLLIQALNLSENSEDNLSLLEQNATNSSKIINDLSSKISSMQNIISLQQTQLQQDLENSKVSEEQWRNKSELSEKTIDELSASYNSLLSENQGLKAQVAKLEKANLRKVIVIVIEGVIIAAFAALAILKFAVKLF